MGTNLRHAGVIIIVMGTSGSWVGHGPWAMPHLAYFWLDNFKSYFGKCDTFVQSMSN